MKKLRHLVLLGFKQGTTDGKVQALIRQFVDLSDKIPQIKSLEWGEDVSCEGLQNGHTHAFLLTFDSEQARDIYLPHPDHVALADAVKPHLGTVTVVDYWA